MADLYDTGSIKIKISSFFNLLFLAYVIIWPAVSRLIIKIDEAGRIGFFLLALVIFFNFNKLSFWRILKIKPVMIRLLWCVYAAVAWLMIGIPNEKIGGFLFLHGALVMPMVSMWVATYEMKRDAKFTVLALCAFYAVYVFLGIFLQQGAKLYNGRVSGGLWNNLPLTSLAFISAMCIANVMGWIKKKWVVLAIVMAVISTLMVATRKAFVGIGIVTVFWYVSINDVKKASSLIMAVLTTVFAVVAITYVMDNTVIGERFSIVEDQGRVYNDTGVALFNILGDRLTFYINGWALFLKHPIIGIGLNNYVKVLPSDMPIHSEYMVQLAETGIIGTSLFLAFTVMLLRRIGRLKHIEKYCKLRLALYGALFFILFIDLSAWTYSSRSYAIIMAVIIGMTEMAMGDTDNDSDDKSSTKGNPVGEDSPDDKD